MISWRKNLPIKSLTISLFLYYIRLIDAMLQFVLSVKDHRRHSNVVRTSVTHLFNAVCATVLLSPHFDVIRDFLLIRRAAKWNLFVKSKTH